MERGKCHGETVTKGVRSEKVSPGILYFTNNVGSPAPLEANR